MTVLTISKTGTGRSTFAVPDYFIAPFNIGLQAVVTGTVTYNIEYTLDDTQADGFNPATAQWNVMAAPFSAAQVTTAGAFTTPCRGISINITAGTGSVALTIAQSGTR